MSHIYETLYLGNIQDAQYVMTDADFVVNCTPDIPFFAPHAKHFRIPIADSKNEIDQHILYAAMTNTSLFYDLVEALHQRKTIFIHCWVGMSRSATLMVCFLMYYTKHVLCEDYSIGEIIRYVRKKRYIVFEHGFNFMDTIVKYDAYLRREPS